ncbi:MAG TPA: alpha/beta fold hydrolase [Acidimicrobiales bacterium]|nr:alpha/beta fold hydrolase [Acidimicrobiales bacterium]
MPWALTDDDVRIHYQAFGRAAGEPVLMVQGLGTDSRGWLAQRRAFGRRYRCLAPDHRGLGRSDRPDTPVDLPRLVDDLVTVLDHAEVERAHVMGASMGGILAQLLAITHPDRVSSLVLACTACHHTAWRRELLDEWADIARTQGMRAFANRNMRWIVGPRSLRRFWPLMGVLGPVMMGAPVATFAGQIEAILSMDDSIRAELSTIDVPTLVIVGSQDILTPLADSEELAERIPGAELAVVRGGAHGFMVEHAAAYNRVVTGFVDRVIAAQRDVAGTLPAPASAA